MQKAWKVLEELAQDLAFYGFRVRVNTDTLVVSDGINKYVLSRGAENQWVIAVNGAEVTRVKGIKAGTSVFRSLVLKDVVYVPNSWRNNSGTELITLHMPRAILDVIHSLVKRGFFPNRSEAIRALVITGLRFFASLFEGNGGEES